MLGLSYFIRIFSATPLLVSLNKHFKLSWSRRNVLSDDGLRVLSASDLHNRALQALVFHDIRPTTLKDFSSNQDLCLVGHPRFSKRLKVMCNSKDYLAMNARGIIHVDSLLQVNFCHTNICFKSSPWHLFNKLLCHQSALYHFFKKRPRKNCSTLLTDHRSEPLLLWVELLYSISQSLMATGSCGGFLYIESWRFNWD